MLPLYIDPGTGSLLFSVVIGTTAAAYFVFFTLFIKLRTILSGGRVKRDSKHKYVIYAEDKRYWVIFKPILEEFENRGIEVLYLTSSEDDPVFNVGYKITKAELLGKGNKAFARLNFLSADVLLSSTPGLDVFHWKRSKLTKHYCHILHSTDESSYYEMFALDYYDSILLSGGEFQEEAVRKLEKARKIRAKELHTVGCTYLDDFAKRMVLLPKAKNDSFTVMVSPSWGKSALLSLYGEELLDPLVNTGWRIIVRPHPQTIISESDIINRLSAHYANNSNFEWDFERENLASLARADILISDFSGIIMDYMFLRLRPVIYVSHKVDFRPLDAHLIYKDQDEGWIYKMLKKAGIELKPELFGDLPDIISRAVRDTSLESAIKEAKAEAWHYQGMAAKRVVDFMITAAE